MKRTTFNTAIANQQGQENIFQRLRRHRIIKNFLVGGLTVFAIVAMILAIMFYNTSQKVGTLQSGLASTTATTTSATQKIADLEQKLADADKASTAKIQELNAAKVMAEANADSAIKAQIAAEANKAKVELEVQQAKNLQAIAEKALAESDKEKAGLMQQLAIANARPKETVVVQEVPRATPAPAVFSGSVTGLPATNRISATGVGPSKFNVHVSDNDKTLSAGLRRIAGQEKKDPRAAQALIAAADALDAGRSLKDTYILIAIEQGLTKKGFDRDAGVVHDALKELSLMPN